MAQHVILSIEVGVNGMLMRMLKEVLMEVDVRVFLDVGSDCDSNSTHSTIPEQDRFTSLY
jgi:hypothetical protein